MAKITYARARKDFEYLEQIDELDDQVEVMSALKDFMQNPTKEFAKGLYIQSIELWFGEHAHEWNEFSRRTRAIAERYALELVTGE